MNIRRIPRIGIAATLLASLALAATPVVLSQSGPGDAEEDTYRLPAFAVQGQQLGYNAKRASTALKFSLPILETPQSLFVINDALIEDQQAFRFDQILQNDSSVQKRNNFLGAYSSHYIRGFSLQNGSNYLRNGRTFFHLASPPIEILERTEVLKGPSSVLYGTVAPGGMINMVTKKPIPQQAGFVKATIGEDSLRHFHLDTGGPITSDGVLSYRLDLASEDSEYFRSFGNGDPFEVSRRIAYLAVDWDLAPRTSIHFNADVTDDDRPQDIGLVAVADTVEGLPTETIISQPWSHYNSDVWNAMVSVDHRFADQSYLRAGYSFQNYKRDRYDNQVRSVDGETGDITMRARRRVNRWDYHTLFADYGGRIESGRISHEYLVGVDRTFVDRDNNETARNETFVTNIFDPVYIPNPGISTREAKNTGEEIRLGLYAQDMISIGQQWRALLGLRYDDYQTDFFAAGTPLWDYSTNNLTPRLGLVYLPQANLSWYATYSESFEPNSPVDASFDNAGQALDPTVGEMFEVGSKWELQEGRMLVTAALFTIDRDGDPFEDTLTNTIVQRGLQRSKGFETAVSGLVNDHLTLTASFNYLDSEFVADDNPSIVGNRPAGAAEYSFSAWGEYQFNDGPLQRLSLQGGWFYESDRPVDNANSFDLDAYHRFDFGLKYVMPLAEKSSLTYRLTASNVFDETYYKGDRATEINVERPREIRLSAQYTF